MKTTTTIDEIIRAEAQKQGISDVFNKDVNRIPIEGDEYSIMQQVARYTPTIKKITDKVLFGYYILTSEHADKMFKQMFLNRFYNREIGFQTVDLFRNKCAGLLASNDLFLSQLTDNFDKYAQGFYDSDSETKSTQTETAEYVTRDRSAHQSLPQDKASIILDPESDDVPYADDADYQNTGNKSADNTDKTTTTHQSGHRFSVENLTRLQHLYDRKLDEFEEVLFLHVW